MAKSEKRPRGRPKSQNPLVRKTIRVTETDWAAIIEAGGDNANAWIRKTLLRAAKRNGKK